MCVQVLSCLTPIDLYWRVSLLVVVDIITGNPKARWSHARFGLVINDDCLGFGFVCNIEHNDDMVKAIMDLDKAIETKCQK